MSFYDVYLKYKDFDFSNHPLISLLSPMPEDKLEELAQEAHGLTLKFFGRTVQLYAPLYLSNYCDNECAYCGFNSKNDIQRKKLTLDEVEKEAQFISAGGLKHILILTGESRSQSPLSYIKNCIKILKRYFSSISIEIYPLQEDEYGELISEGVDGLTIYQETYDELIYDKLHLAGPKKDYKFRLDACERAAKRGMRNINIGVLLGLNDFGKEVFLLGLHAKYLQDRFPELEIGISIPRVQPQVSNFRPECAVSDKNLAQIIIALRIFLPRLAITLSTRENHKLRDNLMSLGITRLSAGSSTYVGGYSLKEYGGTCQFEISDKRTVSEIKEMLENKGYQPVFKNWMRI